MEATALSRGVQGAPKGAYSEPFFSFLQSRFFLQFLLPSFTSYSFSFMFSLPSFFCFCSICCHTCFVPSSVPFLSLLFFFSLSRPLILCLTPTCALPFSLSSFLLCFTFLKAKVRPLICLYFSLYLLISLSTMYLLYLCICIIIYFLSIFLSIHLSIYLSIHPSIYLFVC